MTRLLIRIFIRNYQDTENPAVRRKYGNFASGFGVFTNLLICIFKLVSGFLFGMISLIADGFNNLSDAATSLISLIGFKLSEKPADKGHPFGHARIEYISGFIVSIIVVILGIQLMINSIEDIANHWNKEYTALSDTEFVITIAVLSVAILFKLYQGIFYYKIGKIISSVTLKAASCDSRNDVIATSAVLVGLIISHLFSFYIDGYLGCAVGLFILISGIRLIKETSDPLIGQSIDPRLIQGIVSQIKTHPEILGVHDLQIHAYGPSIYFASIHAEVDAHGDILSTHDVIDNIEKEIHESFGVILTVHMDPVVLNDPYTDDVRAKVIPEIEKISEIANIHDFRVVKGPTHTNVVFDVVVRNEKKADDEAILAQIQLTVASVDPSYHAVVTIDHDYAEYDEE